MDQKQGITLFFGQARLGKKSQISTLKRGGGVDDRNAQHILLPDILCGPKGHPAHAKGQNKGVRDIPEAVGADVAHVVIEQVVHDLLLAQVAEPSSPGEDRAIAGIS